jgi:hypothetical protein
VVTLESTKSAAAPPVRKATTSASSPGVPVRPIPQASSVAIMCRSLMASCSAWAIAVEMTPGLTVLIRATRPRDLHAGLQQTCTA